jgi:hypothetical protein
LSTDGINSDFSQSLWQSPPPPIDQMLGGLETPTVLLSPNQQWLVELQRPLLCSIAELTQPEVAIAGLRINPKSSCLSRTSPYTVLTLKSIGSNTDVPLDLPENYRFLYPSWSANGQHLALSLVQETGLELWIVSLPGGSLTRLTDPFPTDGYLVMRG